MCGIFGYAKLGNKGFNPHDVNLAMRFLALENETRGKDSTGLAVVDQYNKSFIVTKTKTAETFLQSDFVSKAMQTNINIETAKVIGHTRFATHGAVTKKNAQPFRYATILGAHNGVIQNHDRVMSQSGLKPHTECDSEAIYALLSLAVSFKGMARQLRRLEGYWSIAFHDFCNPQNLYFSRYNNTLSIGMTKDKSAVLWSSSWLVLDKFETLFNIPLDNVDLKDGYLMGITPEGKTFTKKIKSPPVYKYLAPKYENDWNFADQYRGRVSNRACLVCSMENNVKYSMKHAGYICDSCEKYFEGITQGDCHIG